MSITSQKNNIINQIKLYTSIQNTNVDFSQPINFDGDDPIDFLFSLIKIVVGESKLEGIVEQYFQNFFSGNGLKTINTGIKNSIISSIPENLIIPQLNTIEIPIKSIDFLGQLKKNSVDDPFLTFFKDVLKNPDTEKTFQGLDYMNFSFNPIKNIIILKIIGNLTIKKIISDLFDVSGDIIKSNDIIETILKILFGYGEYDTDNYNMLLTLINNYINYENQEVFEIDLSKLLEQQITEEQKGYKVDVSCIYENISIDQNQVTEITNSTNLISSFNQLVPTTTNFKNDYHKNLIKSIIKALLLLLFKNPIFNLILNLSKFLLNPAYTFITNIPEYFKLFAKSLGDLFELIYDEFICYIFNFIKNEISKIVLSVAIILLKEKITKRNEIYQSLL